MNCQDIARILDEREVVGLLADEKSRVEAHLAGCRDCARDWQIHAQLADAPIPPVPAGLRADFPTRAAGNSRPAARRQGRLAAVGALVAVAAAAAMLVSTMNGPAAPSAAAVEALRMEPAAAPLSESPAAPATLMPDDEPSPDQDANDFLKSPAMKEWRQRVAEWLAVRDEPDALLTTAMLLMSPPRDERRIRLLLQRAAELAPDNARIQATVMLLCPFMNPCDTTPYERALRRIAPDNALAWVGDVSRASRTGDREALESAFALMARARTFDLYDGANMVAMTAQITAARVAPPHGERANPPVLARSAIVRMPLPAIKPVLDSCKSETDEKRLLECRQIGAAMRAGDTILLNLLGVQVSRAGLEANSAAALALAKQRRQFQWLDLKMQGLVPEDDPSGLLGVLAAHPRQMDAWRALLQERGVPVEPPEDWKP